MKRFWNYLLDTSSVWKISVVCLAGLMVVTPFLMVAEPLIFGTAIVGLSGLGLWAGIVHTDREGKAYGYRDRREKLTRKFIVLSELLLVLAVVDTLAALFVAGLGLPEPFTVRWWREIAIPAPVTVFVWFFWLKNLYVAIWARENPYIRQS